MIEKLSQTDGEMLLELARKSIAQKFGSGKDSSAQIRLKLSKLILKENRGTFVSLHKKGQLRGCIGNIEPVKTIFDGICENARNAAFKDSRFVPLSENELADTQIEISILTQPERLEYLDADDLVSKLKPNVHGVIVEKGYHRATFLPQVWSQLSKPDEFLSHLCIKAGLPSDEWKTGKLEVLTYQVQSFEEPV